MLTCAPPLNPYSAVYEFAWTLTSAIASMLVMPLKLPPPPPSPPFTPSVYTVLPPRPWKVGTVDWYPPPHKSWSAMIETPGRVLKIDIGSRPFTAIRSIILLSTVVAWAEVVVATAAPWAVTRTDSVTLPTSSCNLPSASRPAATTRLPFCSSGRNPAASARTVYAPGTNAPKKKSPTSFVVPDRSSPLSSNVSLTFAPGTACPVGSDTVPAMEPVEPCCAEAIAPSPSASMIDQHIRFTVISSFRLTPATCVAVRGMLSGDRNEVKRFFIGKDERIVLL